MRKPLVILLVCSLLASCVGREATPQAQEHPYSQSELQKLTLDEVSSEFWESLGLENASDIKSYLQDHVRIVPWPGKTALILVSDDGREVARGRVSLVDGKPCIDVSILDRVAFSGTLGVSLDMDYEDTVFSEMMIIAIDEGTDVTVTLDGKPIGKLGFEAVHENQAGQDYWRPDAVLRFEDGSSYSLSGLLLVGPMIDYFLKNAGNPS